MVMVLAACLGMLSLSYFRVARESLHTGKWHELKYTACEAARSLQEEAYATLVKDLKNQKSQAFWFMLGAVSGARNEMRLPFARQNLEKMLPEGYGCDFSCELKIVSFKAVSPDGRPYFGRYEGHGILGIITRVEIFVRSDKQRKPVGRHTLEAHHDYLVASMLSPDSHGLPLKNALIVRKQRDFDSKSTIESDAVQLLTYQNEPPGSIEHPENLQVFDRYSLWARRDLSVEDLQRLRILDTTTRTLNLNGINHCRGSISLDGQWQIRGQGVLIADSFVISASLKKTDPTALAIFFARNGNICVNTSAEIHAALIAINRNGSGQVDARQPMNLNGMLLADILNLQNWSPGKHTIVYDRMLSDPEKTFQISVSRWVNYLGSGEKS